VEAARAAVEATVIEVTEVAKATEVTEAIEESEQIEEIEEIEVIEFTEEMDATIDYRHLASLRSIEVFLEVHILRLHVVVAECSIREKAKADATPQVHCRSNGVVA